MMIQPLIRYFIKPKRCRLDSSLSLAKSHASKTANLMPRASIVVGMRVLAFPDFTDGAFVILQSGRSRFRARGLVIRVKNTSNPQTFSDLEEHRCVFDLNYLAGSRIGNVQRKLRLRPKESLLNIGCGGGALAIRAAEGFGQRALGSTLSEEQYAGASAAIDSSGVQGKARVLLENYERLVRARNQFDKIVSIGMAEHVGEARPAEFIRSLETLLKPGGLALLYLITGIVRRPTNGWTEKCIFPGSYIPTLAEISNHVSERDFHVWDVENLGPHYKSTFDHWSDRFERSVPFIRKTFDDRFGRGAALSARLGGQFPGGDHRSASDPSFPRPLEPPSHARRPLLGVGDLRAHFAAQYLLEVQSGRGWSQQVKERKYAG